MCKLHQNLSDILGGPVGALCKHEDWFGERMQAVLFARRLATS